MDQCVKKIKMLSYFQVPAEPTELNRDQICLREITKEAVCAETDLYDFGLLLGYQHHQIKQKRANHPFSIENAALEMVCEYWGCNSISKTEKVRVVQTAVEGTGKVTLANKVQYMLGTDARGARKMLLTNEPNNSVNDSHTETKAKDQGLLSEHFLKCYFALILASIFLLVNALSL